MRRLIRFEKVSKSFKGQQQAVLHQIDLEIPDNEIVVLIGPSGCGKTTSLKMINRLLRPDAGRIMVGDRDVQQVDPIELRRGMGYVVQQTGLFPHMTIQQNIEIIPKLQKRDPHQVMDRTIGLMKMIGLDAESYLYRYPTQLSGGQQQRIGVARAFATDPEIVLMDEPFSALDPITRVQLQDELLGIQAQLHKTIVFVTHDMDEAIKIADRICIMHAGSVLQYDTPENLLKHPADGFVQEFVGTKRIWSNPEMIRARDIMITTPVVASERVSLVRAVEIMRMRKVDSLMILDENHCLTGLLSAGMLDHSMQGDTPVSRLMKREVVSAHAEDSIVALLKVINETGFSTLPIVDDGGRLVGLVTKGSLVSTLSRQFIETGEEARA